MPSVRPYPAQGDDHTHAFIEEVNGRLNFETHVVLVVDDEPDVRKLISREIKHAAPEVLTVEAGHGEEALTRLADIRSSFRVDPLFIVLDLHMPVMDGWETIDKLRQDYEKIGLEQGVPIIVLSSTSGEKRRGLVHHSVHGNKAAYIPLVSVAKESCVDPARYDAVGKQGLAAWIHHFLKD